MWFRGWNLPRRPTRRRHIFIKIGIIIAICGSEKGVHWKVQKENFSPKLEGGPDLTKLRDEFQISHLHHSMQRSVCLVIPIRNCGSNRFSWISFHNENLYMFKVFILMLIEIPGYCRQGGKANTSYYTNRNMLVPSEKIPTFNLFRLANPQVKLNSPLAMTHQNLRVSFWFIPRRDWR